MLVKCGMVVLAIGATACGLLTLRQSRLQAASELAQAQIRIGASDEHLWALRSQIAARVTPGNVERMAQSVGPLRPIAFPPMVAPAPGDALPTLTLAPRVQGAPGGPVVLVSNSPSIKHAPSTSPAPTSATRPNARDAGPVTKLIEAPSSKKSAPAPKAGTKPGAKPKTSPAKPNPDTLLRASAGSKAGTTQVALATSPSLSKPSATTKTPKPSGAAQTNAAKKPKATPAKPTQLAIAPSRP